MIYLVQLLKDSRRAGGTAIFTEHLKRGMGDRATVVRIMREDGADKKPRIFANECEYLNVSMDVFDEMLKANPGPILICANDGGSEAADFLMRCRDAWFVYHDYRSLQDMTYEVEDTARTIVIRETNLVHCCKATFIPHPYECFYKDGSQYDPERTIRAVCHTRIDFDKRTHVVLGANRLLPDKLKVLIRGRENRLYGKHKLQAEFPEWTIGTSELDRRWGIAAEFCSTAIYDVDMTRIRGDGEGSQYSHLEAMDGGAIPIVASDWGTCPFFAASVNPDPVSLATFLMQDPPFASLDEMRAGNTDYLRDVHDAKMIADVYVDLLSKG